MVENGAAKIDGRIVLHEVRVNGIATRVRWTGHEHHVADIQ
jgi:hypothetical protein